MDDYSKRLAQLSPAEADKAAEVLSRLTTARAIAAKVGQTALANDGAVLVAIFQALELKGKMPAKPKPTIVEAEVATDPKQPLIDITDY